MLQNKLIHDIMRKQPASPKTSHPEGPTVEFPFSEEAIKIFRSKDVVKVRLMCVDDGNSACIRLRNQADPVPVRDGDEERLGGVNHIFIKVDKKVFDKLLHPRLTVTFVGEKTHADFTADAIRKDLWFSEMRPMCDTIQ